MAARSKMSEREKEGNAHYCELRHSRLSCSSPRMPAQSEIIIFWCFQSSEYNVNPKMSRREHAAEITE